MLVDIVERLSNWKHASFRRDGSTLETMMEAANEITTLRNRVRELEEIRQWRPIDTAPKDNKPYLFYRNGDIRTAFRKGNNWGSRGIGWQYEFDENVKNGFTENLPTHWQSLPEPPKE